MELKHIKDLMGAMRRTGTKRLRIKQDNYELELEREDPICASEEVVFQEPEESFSLSGMPSVYKTKRSKVSDIPASLHPPVDQGSDSKKEITGKFVTSPMVGTFYYSPGPEDPPFVKVGDAITKDTVVCIIEAMKVMNEVKAGVEGTLVERLVETGRPVEFGTKLFMIS